MTCACHETSLFTVAGDKSKLCRKSSFIRLKSFSSEFHGYGGQVEILCVGLRCLNVWCFYDRNVRTSLVRGWEESGTPDLVKSSRMEPVEGNMLDNYLSDARNTLLKLSQQQSRRSGGDMAVVDPVQKLLGQLRQWTEAGVSLRGDGLAETPRGEPLHTEFTFLPREMMMKVELEGFEECTLNVEVEEKEIRLQLYMESRLAHLGCTGLSVNGVSKIYHLPYPIVPPLASASVQKNQLTICVPWQLIHTGRSILRKPAV